MEGKKTSHKENGQILENKIIDDDENILKDERIQKLIKEQEELINQKRLMKLNQSQKIKNPLIEKIELLDKEISDLKKEISESKTEIKLNKGEKMMSLIFIMKDFDVEYSVVCKNSEKLSDIFEKKVRIEMDGLESYDEYEFKANNTWIDPESPIKNFPIEDGDIIHILNKN